MAADRHSPETGTWGLSAAWWRDVIATRLDSLEAAAGRPPCVDDVVREVVWWMGADRGNIQFRDSKSNSLRIAGHAGFGHEFLEFFAHVDDTRSACGTALATQAAVVVPDVTTSPIFADTDTLRVLLNAQCRAVESVPLLSTSGDVFGVVSVHYRSPQIEYGSDGRQLAAIAAAVAPTLESRWS